MYEITSMITLSTGHLTEEACNHWLPNACPWAVFEKGDWGYFMYVTDDNMDDTTPQCVVDAITFARGAFAQWIMFDSDGPLEEGLPSYDR